MHITKIRKIPRHPVWTNGILKAIDAFQPPTTVISFFFFLLPHLKSLKRNKVSLVLCFPSSWKRVIFACVVKRRTLCSSKARRWCGVEKITRIKTNNNWQKFSSRSYLMDLTIVQGCYHPTFSEPEISSLPFLPPACRVSSLRTARQIFSKAFCWSSIGINDQHRFSYLRNCLGEIFKLLERKNKSE